MKLEPVGFGGPKDRAATLEARDAARVRGERARNALNSLRPFMEDLRSIYTTRLTRKMRDTGEADGYAVHGIVVLEDIANYLEEMDSRGRSAERKIQKILKEES